MPSLPPSLFANLPWFIREPATALIGQKCYTSLVERLDIRDVDCLKYALSKGLGLGIVVGGSIVKVPQVLLILSAKSARGLSLTAYVMETASYAITLAYAARGGFPFSTYGENLFLTLQNVLITLLIVHHLPAPRASFLPQRSAPTNARAVAGTLIAFAGGAVGLARAPLGTLALLQLATLPLALASKLPQIAANARARSTGQLSAFAVGAQVAGCAARIFTTATEVGDRVVLLGFVLALALNLVLALQLWMYWGDGRTVRLDDGTAVQEKLADRDFGWASGAQPHAESTTLRAPASAPSAPPQASPTRRWARKVD